MKGIDANGLTPGMVLRPHLEIAPREVEERRRRGDSIRMIDCRTEAERELACIDGAEHVPMERVHEWIEDLGEDHPAGDATTGTIVVHCHHGVRSLQVVALLHAAGFQQARSMAGGIDLWSRAVDPTVATY